MKHHILAVYRRSLTVVGLICLLFSSFATGTISYAAQNSIVTVTSDNNDAHDGDLLTFSAWVSCDGAVATGTVSFYDNSTLIDSIALQDGVAAVSETPAAGSHLIEAVYSGDQNCAPSRGSLDQIIGGNTTTSVSASPNPATTTQTVTITAQVMALNSCAFSAGDTVTFTDDVFTSQGTLSVNKNTGTASVSGTFSAGIHNIKATFNAEGSCPSSSGKTTLTITAAVGSSGTTNVTPSCPTGYPILGSVIVSKPQSAFDKPNGNEIVDSNNRKVILPNPDFPGPAIYSVITEQTVGGKLWYGLFVGGCNPAWVPAAGVTVKQPITF